MKNRHARKAVGHLQIRTVGFNTQNLIKSYLINCTFVIAKMKNKHAHKAIGHAHKAIGHAHKAVGH